MTPRKLTDDPRLLLLGGAALLVAGLQFWIHDALPYVVDYTEATYSRYWPHRTWLIPHLVGGTVALFAGPLQLWPALRSRAPHVHRALGYGYAIGVLASAVFSFPLAPHARVGFGLSLAILAGVWILSTLLALVAARNRRFDTHREWMIRSYIITFSFVSYRYLVGLSVFAELGPSRPAVVLWISWVVPMMAFELYQQRGRVGPRPDGARRPDAVT